MYMLKIMIYKLFIILIFVRKFNVFVLWSSFSASSRLPGIDSVFRMFWNDGQSWIICCMDRFSWHSLQIGSGSLLIRKASWYYYIIYRH